MAGEGGLMGFVPPANSSLMVTNKNQHYVPQAYFRPFTEEGRGVHIDLFNIDRELIVFRVPVRHQCSGSYFYGTDSLLEKAIQNSERLYGSTVGRVHQPGYTIAPADMSFLLQFWLLQYLRTDAAARRDVELAQELVSNIGPAGAGFTMTVKEAVLQAMRFYEEELHAMDDLGVALFLNKSATPFVTSDDPAVLTNRWYLEDRRVAGRSFGFGSAGTLVILPLSPTILLMGFDRDVYRVKSKDGWVTLREEESVRVLNEHQFLNCRANVYFQSQDGALKVEEQFSLAKLRRLKARYRINYAVLDPSVTGPSSRYTVVNRDEFGGHEDALMHSEALHAVPSSWPRHLQWVRPGAVYLDGNQYKRWGCGDQDGSRPRRSERAGPMRG